MQINQYNDLELYNQCKNLGKEIFKFRNLFILLIPEVYKRKLYKKYHFPSIHHFAAKLGGLSSNHVNKIINLDRKLQNKPHLKKLLYSGTVGWTKIYTIANIATPETDKFWCSKIITMNKSTLETLRKDLKQEKSIYTTPEFKKVHFSISQKNLKKLNSLKAKHKANTWNELFEIILNSQDNQPQKISTKKVSKNTSSRYIPKHLRKNTAEKTDHLCSHPNCNKPISEFHHTTPFSLEKSHKSIIGVCKEHHQIIHHSEINPVNKQFLKHKKAALNLVQDG